MQLGELWGSLLDESGRIGRVTYVTITLGATATWAVVGTAVMIVVIIADQGWGWDRGSIYSVPPRPARGARDCDDLRPMDCGDQALARRG